MMRWKALPACLALSVWALGAPVAAKDSYDIAVIRWDPSDIYFNGVQAGQEQERRRLEKLHGVKINFRVFGANDASAQRKALDAQLARGVDGVLMVPWRGEAMRTALQDLAKKGTPVVTHNNAVPGVAQTFVAFDNRGAGRSGGEVLVQRLNTLRGQDWAQQGGVLVVMRCIITATFDIDRNAGYRDVFDPLVKANPQLQIETREAGCDGSKARKAMDDLMARHGKDRILAVASIDGTMGVGGVVPALAAQNRLLPPDHARHVPIATIDGTLPELQALSRGHIDHISVQPADGEGALSMRVLFDMIRSGQAPAQAGTPRTVPLDGQPLWGPVSLEPGSIFEGHWYRLRSIAAPGDVRHDDPRLWAVQGYQAAHQGAAPDFQRGQFKD